MGIGLAGYRPAMESPSRPTDGDRHDGESGTEHDRDVDLTEDDEGDLDAGGDPDSPGRSLLDDDDEIVEPNEPG